MKIQCKLLSLLPIFLLLFLSGCAWAPIHHDYRSFYSHLKKSHPAIVPYGDYYLIILVNARHLDYSSGVTLMRTVAKHPNDGTLSGDVGHTWIYLCGKTHVVHGGHTGEYGVVEPKYFDGVMDCLEAGDKNPVCYMQKTLSDGRFEEGAGGHLATTAAFIPLTEEQYQKMLQYIQSYSFQEYSLTSHQCVTFVSGLAQIAGITLNATVTIPIEKCVMIGKERFTLWSDPCYAELNLFSPDLLEKKLQEAMCEKRVYNVLPWYQKSFPVEKCSIPSCEQLFRLWYFSDLH